MVIATASNKLSDAGTGIASGTLDVNADKLFLATSQRALLSNYGTPFFYQTTNGTPINGYELNEYGLLAAYSALGVTNQCYIIRANIDLAALSAGSKRPIARSRILPIRPRRPRCRRRLQGAGSRAGTNAGS
jgi:hypothetical protein